VLYDPRLMRKVWLDTWSQALDGYLRSTAFLQLMQHGLRSMTFPVPPTDTQARSPVEGDSPR
jgi:hypothetical protein